MAVRNHLAMLGMPVPGSREVLPVVESIKVVQLPAVPPTLLQLGLPLAQCGVLPVQSVHPPVLNHGGLQEGAVHALPHVVSVCDYFHLVMYDPNHTVSDLFHRRGL